MSFFWIFSILCNCISDIIDFVLNVYLLGYDFWLNHDNSNEKIVNLAYDEKFEQLIVKNYYDIVATSIDIENKYNKQLGKEQKIKRQIQIDDSFNKLLELSSNDRTDLVIKKMMKIDLDKYQDIYDDIIDVMTFTLVD